MTLAQFTLVINLATLTAVLTVGVWAGDIRARVKALEEWRRKLEERDEVRTYLEGH